MVVRALANVEFCPIGLGRERRVETLYVLGLHDGEFTRVDPASRYRDPCKVEQLDLLDFPAPNFIKCDVEGGELEVFQGAIRTLSHLPVILFEINEHCAKSFNRATTAAVDFLRSLAYDFFVVTESGLVPMRDVRCANLVAVPKEP